MSLASSTVSSNLRTTLRTTDATGAGGPPAPANKHSEGTMRKHCPFAFSGLPRLLAPQDRPFLLFPLSFPPFHQTTVTPQAPPADPLPALLSAHDHHTISRPPNARKLAQLLQAPASIPAHGRQKGTPPAGKRAFSSVQFWDYCRFAQNLPAVFTLKPCSDAQTASSTREQNLSFLSVCLT